MTPSSINIFMQAVEDASWNSKTRKSYISLAKHLSSHAFVNNLGLQDLLELSLELQKWDNTMTTPWQHHDNSTLSHLSGGQRSRQSVRLVRANGVREELKRTLFKVSPYIQGDPVIDNWTRGQFFSGAWQGIWRNYQKDQTGYNKFTIPRNTVQRTHRHWLEKMKCRHSASHSDRKPFGHNPGKRMGNWSQMDWRTYWLRSTLSPSHVRSVRGAFPRLT